MSSHGVRESEDRGDLPQRLAALRQQVANSNPDHYRQLALYLQVLRRVLPGAVDQACFHLATQVAPERYSALPGLKRQALHRRLDALVQQCSSLLTVEQLASLAAHLAEGRRRQQLSQRRRWLEEQGDGSAGAAPPARRPEPDRLDPAAPLPAGSVVLGLNLPLGEAGGWVQLPRSADAHRPDLDRSDADSSADGDGELPDDDDGSAFPWELDFGMASADQPSPRQPKGADDDDEDQDLEGAFWPPRPAGPSGAAPADFRTGESPSRRQPGPEGVGAFDRQEADGAAQSRSDASGSAGADPATRLQASLAALLAAAAAAEAGGVDNDDSAISGALLMPWRSGALPQDPAEQLLWLEGFDQALTRRLRNLSHAINIELLRQELTATLLPPSLLDAVLAGRLESQSAPANLLCLPLPLPTSTAPRGLMGHALLLRCGDLESEHPQLRTCRQRLQRQRQELRRMALLQARLQQRLRTQEAERLWMQTVRRTRSDNR